MIWSLGFLAFLIIIDVAIFIVCLINNKVSVYIDKRKTAFEIFYISTSIITIFSISTGIYQFNYQQEQQRNIQECNNRLILENLNLEINQNLEFIDFIQKNEVELKETFEFPSSTFDFYYLEKSRDVIINQTLRESIYSSLLLLRQSNSELNSIPFFIPLNNNQSTIFKKLKSDLVGGLVNDGKTLRNELKVIKNGIDPIIKQNLNNLDCIH